MKLDNNHLNSSSFRQVGSSALSQVQTLQLIFFLFNVCFQCFVPSSSIIRFARRCCWTRSEGKNADIKEVQLFHSMKNSRPCWFSFAPHCNPEQRESRHTSAADDDGNIAREMERENVYATLASHPRKWFLYMLVTREPSNKYNSVRC